MFRFSKWNESDLEELKAAVQVGIDAALGSVNDDNNNSNGGKIGKMSSPRHRYVDISVRKYVRTKKILNTVKNANFDVI
jgi:hypothetical protein